MYGDDEPVPRPIGAWGLVCLSADMGRVDDSDDVGSGLGSWRCSR
jgi:hypothetical protein